MNLGTPDSTSVADVRRYLRQFLGDPFVLDFPRRWQWLRVPLSLLIAHFRGPQSAHAYRTIWWEEGSPLKVITERQVRALQKRLPGGWRVYYAMRYANPPLRDVLARIVADRITDLVVVPMYPQWSGPTTGTALDELYREIAMLDGTGGLRLNVTVRSDWYDDANYIEAQAGVIHRFAEERGLHPGNAFLLHSTHSLPTVYVERGDPYEGHVRRTIELVNRRLGWPSHRSAVSFQSKLGPVRWLSPSTDQMVRDIAARNEKNLLVCPVSFTADCLETLEEVGVQYAELFRELSGGGTLHLAPAPNDDPQFIKALTHLVRSGPHRLDGDAQFEEPHFASIAAEPPLSELIKRLVMVGVSKAGALPGPQELAIEPIGDDAFQQVKLPQHETAEVLRGAASLPGVSSCWLLNTCQRYELYALVKDEHVPDEAIQRIRELIGPPEGVNVLHGRDAWWHLLRTTVGLNSQLPGDADVIQQLETAQRIAEHAGTTRPAGDGGRILEAARRVVVDVRERTPWREYAVEYCKAALGPLTGALDLDVARIVVVGRSVTSRSLLRMLVEEHQVADERLTVVVQERPPGGQGVDDANRLPCKRLAKFLQNLVQRARMLAVERYDAPDVLDAIRTADVLFLGIDRREPILRREHVANLRDFTERPLTIIDFNTVPAGSTQGLAAIAGVDVVPAARLEEHVERHVTRMLASRHFRSAWIKAEEAIRAFTHDPEEGVSGEPPSARGARCSELGARSLVSLPIVEGGTFEKYTGLSLPRHVAYPMPTWWRDVDGAAVHALRGTSRASAQPRDLSLYLHLPFCERMCKFCACNRTIVRKDGPSAHGRVDRYLAALHKELRRRAADFGDDGRRTVRQIHWGGGTPTYLDCEQIEALHRRTAELFHIVPDAEVSIEIDPRATTREQLQTLRALGFNRVSMGVQDFDRIVQEHIGRVQPLDLVRQAVADCREIGFRSINFDLIYGLPYQTVQSVGEAVARSIELRADRIAFYHYAQIPDRIANQRKLHHHAMPDSGTKLQMFLNAVARFEEAGYEFIGLDHFAKPDEELAKAKMNGRINRNFQGMTTGADLDLIGLGCSAISCFPGRAYVQNVHDPQAYVERLEDGCDPAVRGLALSRDDADAQRADRHDARRAASRHRQRNRPCSRGDGARRARSPSSRKCRTQRRRLMPPRRSMRRISSAAHCER